MRNKKTRFSTVILSVVLLIFSIYSIFTDKIEAKTDPIHAIVFGNKLKIKTLFYPYRDTGRLSESLKRHLEGMTVDSQDNIYLTYSLGDKTLYDYIYKYNKKGKLLKKSPKLALGHGQAISYKNGYLYQIADIQGKTNFSMLKIDPSTFKIIRTWTIPSTIHPNVLVMQDDNTGISVSRYNGGYDINKIHLGEGPDAQRDWHEKIHIDGLVGITPNKEIQGFAIGNGKYYILSNGEYLSCNPDGTNVQHIAMNTTRESEGMAIMKNGKLIFGFNKLNEIFIQQ